MTPTGLLFAGFVALLFVLYWALPPRARAQNALLLAASYVFYISWSPEWLWLLLAATGVDYSVGRALDRPGSDPGVRRRWLLLSVAANVGALAWFKYRGFFAESLDAMLLALGLPGELPTLQVILPIGLSYYTLIKLGYILEVYYRRVPAERSLLVFATYTAFFPQMLAGPITRAAGMLPQLREGRRLSVDWLSRAAGALLLGWWMKGYLADWIAPALVDPVFGAPGQGGIVNHWLALLGYAIQVFCDFAGYSLLAIGTARLFGLELPPNFERPFLSRSMPEFWRRWHISLNTWLFDYLFGPFTTGRGVLHGRIALNLVLVFALSGLWHGARWTFVLWGLAHGVALAVHHHWDAWYRGRCRVDRRWVTARRSTAYALSAWALTQAWFVATLILFRAPDLAAAGAFGAGLFQGPLITGLGLDTAGQVNLLVAFAFVTWHHLEGLPRGQAVRERVLRAPAPMVGALTGAVIVWMLLFAPLARGTFIYAQF